MQHPPKHILEYALLRGIGAIVNVLPYRAALVLAWLMARASFLADGRRVRLTLTRIRAVCGPEVDDRRARAIAWISWRNIVFDGVEMLRVGRITPAWLERHVDTGEGLRTLLAHATSGRGAVLGMAHMGNWELAAVSCHFGGLPIFSVSGRQRNRLTDEYLNTLRRKPGIESLPRGSSAIRGVISRLREGKFLAIMPDVRARSHAVLVPFLGGEASIGEGMAMFARHADVPVFPCWATREGWTRQRYFLGIPVWADKTADKAADVARMTREVMAQLDLAIRSRPDQWFWFNRRWILDPVDPSPTDLPTAQASDAFPDMQPSTGEHPNAPAP